MPVAVRSLKLLGWVAGVVLIAIGVDRIAFSTASIPGGGPVSPSLDSKTRSAGPLVIGLGIAYIRAVRRSPIPTTAVRLLAAMMLLIGVARLLSMAAAGMPQPVWAIATAVEFTAAGPTYWYSTLNDQGEVDDVSKARDH